MTQSPDLYKRRTRPVHAVKFDGDLGDLLEGTDYTLTGSENPGVWQLRRDGIPVLLLVEGEWVVRQRNRDLQIYGNVEFHNTYERVS